MGDIGWGYSDVISWNWLNVLARASQELTLTRLSVTVLSPDRAYFQPMLRIDLGNIQ